MNADYLWDDDEDAANSLATYRLDAAARGKALRVEVAPFGLPVFVKAIVASLEAHRSLLEVMDAYLGSGWRRERSLGTTT